MSFTMRARRTRRVVAILAVGLLAAVVPGTALAAGSGATVVRGIQHEFGSCRIEGVDGYLMDGSLTGCWIVDTFEVKPMPVQGTMLAHGTEHFEGYLGGVFGTFKTTYTYTARFDGATELHGRCHHPIIDGDGVFAGARGELSFTDVVDANPSTTPTGATSSSAARLHRPRATSRRRSRLAWPGRRREARPRPPSPRPASRWRSAARRRPPRSVPPARRGRSPRTSAGTPRATCPWRAGTGGGRTSDPRSQP